MAIITEEIELDGVKYIKTVSDSNYYIERDGNKYSEAIDPIDSNRVYTESNELIEIEPEESDRLPHDIESRS
jgi:hypothetical protein